MKTIVEHLKRAQKKRVVIIGDVMLDEYLFGGVSRISPEAPVPVVREERKEWSLGGAANVARNCLHVGCEVQLIGIVGADQQGERLISILKRDGMSVEGIVTSSDRMTTCKKRVMATHQQLLRIDEEDTFPLTEREQRLVNAQIDAIIPQADFIIVSDYAKGLITPALMHEVVARAKLQGIKVLVDPKGPMFTMYAQANYLKPNLKEFREMVDFLGLDRRVSVIENGRHICRLLSLDGLIVTMGAKGIQYISPRDALYEPALQREVFDITGAGDTVCAFMALALACDLDMQAALQLANHAAAVAVSHLKTYAVSLQELLDSSRDGRAKYITDWAYLKIELDWLRVEQKRIVFTNGCFDLLHAGHIHLLYEAKKRGDILVVALNGDESIRMLKGPGRPIKQLEDRVAVMAALSAVDFVTYFDDETPLRLIEYIRPDVLVKGGDYKVEEIVGFDVLKSYGGRVEVVSYQSGYSTTALINKIETSTKEHAT